MNNTVIRGDSMARYVRKKRRADNRFIVKVTDVSDNDLKDGALMGRLSDYLVEARRDVEEVFDIQVVLITTTDEGRVVERGFHLEIVDTYMFNKFSFLLAMRRAIEGADNYFFNRSWRSRLDKAPAYL